MTLILDGQKDLKLSRAFQISLFTFLVLAIPIWKEKSVILPVCLNLPLISETFVIFLFPLVIYSSMFYMNVLGMCE